MVEFHDCGEKKSVMKIMNSIVNFVDMKIMVEDTANDIIAVLFLIIMGIYGNVKTAITKV